MSCNECDQTNAMVTSTLDSTPDSGFASAQTRISQSDDEGHSLDESAFAGVCGDQKPATRSRISVSSDVDDTVIILGGGDMTTGHCRGFSESDAVHKHGAPLGPGGDVPMNTLLREPSTPWSSRCYSYPLIYCSPNGTISMLMMHDVMVEMTVDRTVRILCAGKFSAASNCRANASCIMHPAARVYQEDVKVFSSFKDDKQAVIGAQGIVFTMKDLSHAYLVSSDKVKGTLPFPRDNVRFPELPRDASLSLFYSSQYGEHLYEQCFQIVRRAQYQTLGEWTSVNINGLHVRQHSSGDVEVNARPRYVTMSPAKGTISVRTHFVHMAVQEGGKAFIKRGVKRVHVSPSGMVVSDGNHTTSMDYFGRIVAST